MAHWIRLLTEIADAADEIALRYFRRTDLRVDTKSNQTPVSEADLAIESAARRIVATRHPELGTLGEEEGATGSTSERLILDPIDATRNFVRGIPVFASLIAIEIEHEIVAGLVSAPALGTRWHAERGAGAWSGGRRLS
ncbi:MAG TPA: inositol monophosphatase family protein, partial [Gemmatimonadales bacterium]|nr:inositol monophosphatase family protein [Gemmatimonadales bacterium]